MGHPKKLWSISCHFLGHTLIGLTLAHYRRTLSMRMSKSGLIMSICVHVSIMAPHNNRLHWTLLFKSHIRINWLTCCNIGALTKIISCFSPKSTSKSEKIAISVEFIKNWPDVPDEIYLLLSPHSLQIFIFLLTYGSICLKERLVRIGSKIFFSKKSLYKFISYKLSNIVYHFNNYLKIWKFHKL